MAFSDLPGWEKDDFAGVADALNHNCARLNKMPVDRNIGVVGLTITAGQWHSVCEQLSPLLLIKATCTVSQIKTVITSHFIPYLVHGIDGETGKFTGYFEAELHGSLIADARYKYPLYGVPAELMRLNLGKFDPSLQGKFITVKLKAIALFPLIREK